MIPKEVRRLNAFMGQELGSNRLGGPVYSWAYSEDTFHNFLSETELDINDSRASGLLVCEWQVKTRKLCPELHDQWVVVKWSDAGAESDWRRQFGDKLPWPSRGYFAPTNAHLLPGVLPDMAATLEFIGKMRAERKRKFAEYVNESTDALDREESQQHERLKDMIGEEFTAFGNPKPGSRGGGISLPLVRPHN